MGEMSCLRCGEPMHYMKREKIQLGEMTSIIRNVHFVNMSISKHT